MQLWSGSTLSSLFELNQRADEGDCAAGTLGDVFRYNVTGGTAYAISVIEYGTDTTFTLGLEATPTPANDNFANAQDLGQELDVDVDGTTVGATLESRRAHRVRGRRLGLVPLDRAEADAGLDRQLRRAERHDGQGLHRQHARLAHRGGLPHRRTAATGVRRLQPPPHRVPREGGHDLRNPGVHQYTHNGAFHLRLRDIWFDATLTQKASATKIRKGQKVTYTIDVENVGTVEIDGEVGMVTSKPDHLTKPVKGTKYKSIDATHGTCKPVMMLANPHPGAVCDITLAPGETSRIVAKVKPSESLSHWAYLGIIDDDLDNEDLDPVNTVVKPKRRHR